MKKDLGIIVKINGAFTIIELLIVAAVVGTLAVIGVTTFPGAQKKVRDTERINDIKQYTNALEVYYTANDGEYPSTSGDMDSICTSYLSTAECPEDPSIVGSYQYVSLSGGEEYFVYSKLESGGGAQKYYVICSNGLFGEVGSNPSGASQCPLIVTPTPTNTPAPTNTPIPTNTPTSTPVPTGTPLPTPTNTPAFGGLPTSTPTPPPWWAHPTPTPTTFSYICIEDEYRCGFMGGCDYDCQTLCMKQTNYLDCSRYLIQHPEYNCACKWTYKY